MTNATLELPIDRPADNPADNSPSTMLARLWLTLGVLALVASGFYSILLVLSRTPAIQDVIPLLDFFHIALVVHVDLSVLIWFLAFEGVLWALLDNGRFMAMAKLSFWLCVAGTVVITLSPFLGADQPLMNNYVPVLVHPVYFAGLFMFAAGFLLLVLRALFFTSKQKTASAFSFALKAAAFAALLAMIALLISYSGLSGNLVDVTDFEILFWGGGHILQFTHSIMLLVVWLWLASATGGNIYINANTLRLLFAVAVAPVLFSVAIYLLYDVSSLEHRDAFTQLMRYGGLTVLPLMLIVIMSVISTRNRDAALRPARNALLASIILFSTGGILGFMIEGVNVVIPAHYHGSIVGVTLAFMGLTYYLLPRLGFRATVSRAARIQPWIYGGGQMMHILGLAWSGGYGVQRKTAGTAQGLENLPEIAGMAMMGLGGLIAIIGGLIFVVVTIRAMWPVKT
ncbi:MAG: cbb3-type cytochrome c oxidase subunit I [Gammaproteobacteria bacterium]|nr:cbb3-type cytochrome c oxidase subunit I [Gammaproteobacteria bacterium]